MLRVIVETELSLGEPDVDEGLVTWFEVRVAAGERAQNIVIGEARVARIHVGVASDLGEPLYHVLDADSGELEVRLVSRRPRIMTKIFASNPSARPVFVFWNIV